MGKCAISFTFTRRGNLSAHKAHVATDFVIVPTVGGTHMSCCRYVQYAKFRIHHRGT